MFFMFRRKSKHIEVFYRQKREEVNLNGAPEENLCNMLHIFHKVLGKDVPPRVGTGTTPREQPEFSVSWVKPHCAASCNEEYM